MGYTKEQNAAIAAFKKKFETDTKTEIDSTIGATKPLTADQIKRLNDLGWMISKPCRT